MIQKSVSGTEFLQKTSIYDTIWFSQSKHKELKKYLFQVSDWAMLLPYWGKQKQ